MNRTLGMALTLAKAGIRVFPCRQHDRRPATVNGFKDATTDERTIRSWFAVERGYNLAIATGPQPNGMNLVVVDVDAQHDGLVTWDAWLAGHAVPETARHRTPSGGMHLFWDASEEVPNGVSRIGTGVDVRGTGGYVLAPPSVAPSKVTGEMLPYEAERSSWIGTPGTVARMPSDLQASCLPPAPPTTNGHRPLSLATGDSVADLAREGWDWFIELEADGWTLSRGNGQDSQWTRPGKDPRLGTSATLHGDGPLVVWSTSVASGGKPTAGGVGESFSPWDYIVTFRADGDTRVAARLVRGVGPRPAGGDLDPTPAQGTPDNKLFPEPEFYAQRPWMAACQQKAQAVGGSPSAHLLAYLCRWATLIPPGYSIPPINGAPSSFDLLGVIAGTSGSGKTSPMRNAATMLPIHRTDLRLGLGIGSGEGIIEAFYDTVVVEGDDGRKPHKERRKVIAGVNFSVSEGLIFADLASRGGTTHVTRLCDAWSGASLSTANASADTFRHIDEDQYRLTLMMGIQADMAHQLMTDSAASQGFVGRLLFCWAEEPRITPRPAPPDPFVLAVPPEVSIPATREHPKRYTPTFLEYPPEVYAEIQGASDARVGQNVPVEDHHHDLMRCKVAGIVALMDGRVSVSLADWSIATALCDRSRMVRLHLYRHRLQKNSDRRHTSAVERAEVEIVIEDIKERQAIARMAEAIRRVVMDGSVSRGKVTRRVSASSTRHRFEPALSLAISNGWVRVLEDRIEPA